jgi:hypothetical protein
MSVRTRCGTRLSPPRWMPGFRCATCRKPPPMRTPGPRCDTTGLAAVWTCTRPILSPPMSQARLDSARQRAAVPPDGRHRQADSRKAPAPAVTGRNQAPSANRLMDDLERCRSFLQVSTERVILSCQRQAFAEPAGWRKQPSVARDWDSRTVQVRHSAVPDKLRAWVELILPP